MDTQPLPRRIAAGCRSHKKRTTGNEDLKCKLLFGDHEGCQEWHPSFPCVHFFLLPTLHRTPVGAASSRDGTQPLLRRIAAGCRSHKKRTSGNEDLKCKLLFGDHEGCPCLNLETAVGRGVECVIFFAWQGTTTVTVQSPSSNPLSPCGRGLGRGFTKPGGTERLQLL